MAQETVTKQEHSGWKPTQFAQISQRRVRISFAGGVSIFDHGTKQDLRPVHVVKNGKEETIVYKAKIMDEGKPYVVEWYGEKIALIKKNGGIRMVSEDES